MDKPEFSQVLSNSQEVVSADKFQKLATNRDRQDAIWNYLTKKLNLSPLHSAAIMGNIAVETGYSFSPSTVQGNKDDYQYNVDDSIGYGLLQWTYSSRKEGLKDYALSHGGKVDDYDIQLDYMFYETTQPEFRTSFSRFLKMEDLGDATSYFCQKIENPSISHMDRRISEAERIYNYYR